MCISFVLCSCGLLCLTQGASGTAGPGGMSVVGRGLCGTADLRGVQRVARWCREWQSGIDTGADGAGLGIGIRPPGLRGRSWWHVAGCWLVSAGHRGGLWILRVGAAACWCWRCIVERCCGVLGLAHRGSGVWGAGTGMRGWGDCFGGTCTGCCERGFRGSVMIRTGACGTVRRCPTW